ncbi:MAG: hypothetical protein KDA52_13750 [Planctomycetaceae bacterium]|nr:hypothetical protein [Planctomycetaceae bacterium]
MRLHNVIRQMPLMLMAGHTQLTEVALRGRHRIGILMQRPIAVECELVVKRCGSPAVPHHGISPRLHLTDCLQPFERPAHPVQTGERLSKRLAE